MQGDIAKRLSEKELKAVLKLLEDPDPQVYEHVKKVILSQGMGIIGELQLLNHISENELARQRSQTLIKLIEFDSIMNRFVMHKQEGEIFLLELFIDLQKWLEPRYADFVQERFKRLERIIWLETNETDTALDKIRTLNRLFFDIYSYKGILEPVHWRSYLPAHLLRSYRASALFLSLLYTALLESVGVFLNPFAAGDYIILAYSGKDFYQKVHYSNVHFFIALMEEAVILEPEALKKLSKEYKAGELEDLIEPLSLPDATAMYISNLQKALEKDSKLLFSNALSSLYNELIMWG
ncbi:MAG: hypothetical protein GXO48_07310 [Chlorobi bacterium]|nr:hypothetical protein [Chlorobiota bacterium]